MLEVPPEWNEVPDLMMEDKDGMIITEAVTKQKRDGEELYRIFYYNVTLMSHGRLCKINFRGCMKAGNSMFKLEKHEGRKLDV